MCGFYKDIDNSLVAMALWGALSSPLKESYLRLKIMD